MDQAHKLRQLINASLNSEDSKKDARIIAVTSGKGGVGKTSLTVNMAIAMSKLGKKVAVIDADLGMANVDVLLGIVPKYTLAHVIRNEKSMSDVMVEGPAGIRILSGGSGAMDLVNLDEESVENLIEGLVFLNSEVDYVFIDTGAGIGKSVISFIEAAEDVIVVITPDPTSITDAYALIKNINYKEKKIKVIVNRVESVKDGKNVFSKISLAAEKFLNLELENLGYIYEDKHVKKSVRSQNAFLISSPHCLASHAVEMLVYNLENNNVFDGQTNRFSRFVGRLFSLNS